MTDKDLVERILIHKSEEAFRLLYRSKTPMLYRIAVRLAGGDTTLAEDFIQDTWIGAIRNLKSFRWGSELQTWLTSILINTSSGHFRKNGQFMEDIEMIDEPLDHTTTAISIDLEKAIDSLPPGYRQVIVLHDIEGYKHAEIAMMLGINEGTSKSQLAHARNRLRKFLTN